MTVFTGLVTFAIIWWMVFFCALPFGVQRNPDPELGEDPGAPANPRLLLKAGVTTAIAAALTVAAYFAVESGLISFVPSK
ncbi:MAG: DUF1467 family protein [Alphaproteobacteria bacterium]|nr:DUF1467 family protein [Alphaproteobacteria bacterium]